MDHLKMHTPNKADENFRKLAELFPNAVTETKNEQGEVVRAIDKDVLMQEINTKVVEGRDERYRFTWPDKGKSIHLANAPIAKTLRPCREESVNFDTTENLYIEGDNLEVLKLLQETYLGKIKMIYIDPPYNTGNDFVYEDDYSMDNAQFIMQNGGYDEQGNRLFKNMDTNGRFHTDWLNMMYPRLKLARDLLTDDGVIFISIDDNEVDNLRKCCDEIFGTDNFLFQIAWRRTDNQSNNGRVARVKEYITVYCKNNALLKLGKLPLTEKAKKEYRYQDEKGVFRRKILLDKTRGEYQYPIITKSGNLLNGPWMIKEDEFKKLNLENGIYWTNGGDEQPYGKKYLSDDNDQIPNDFWGIEFGTNQRGSSEVEKLFNNRYFDFPKPVSLIVAIIDWGEKRTVIIFSISSPVLPPPHMLLCS